jgi:hypothetical protein
MERTHVRCYSIHGGIYDLRRITLPLNNDKTPVIQNAVALSPLPKNSCKNCGCLHDGLYVARPNQRA